MRLPQIKTRSLVNLHKAEIHVTDFIISSVVALFLVTLIASTVGIEQFNFPQLNDSSVELLSSIHSPNGFNLNLGSNSSMLIKVSILIALAVLILLIYSFSHLSFTKKMGKINNDKRQQYQNYFASSIAEDENKSAFEKKNKLTQQNKEHLSIEDLTNTNNRQLLLNELKGMYSFMSGSEKIRLKELYYALGFIDGLPDKFKSPDWVQRVEAIQEVKQFEVAKYYPTIFKLINDPNETVRRNSLIARIDLTENPLDILKDIHTKLSIWEKHNIALALEKLPKHRLPNFQDLIKKHFIHHEFLHEMKVHFNQETPLVNLQENVRLHVV